MSRPELRLKGDAYMKRYQDDAREYLGPDDTNETLLWATKIIKARTEFMNNRRRRA